LASRLRDAITGDGYFEFFLNPRGSYGQGEAFTRANVKDFGQGDLRDILAGVDRVLSTAPVDEKRLSVVSGNKNAVDYWAFVYYCRTSPGGRMRLHPDWYDVVAVGPKQWSRSGQRVRDPTSYSESGDTLGPAGGTEDDSPEVAAAPPPGR
jgi:Prolyl oligopeptidase family